MVALLTCRSSGPLESTSGRAHTFDQLEAVVVSVCDRQQPGRELWTGLRDKPDDVPLPDAVGQLAQLLITETCDVWNPSCRAWRNTGNLFQHIGQP